MRGGRRRAKSAGGRPLDGRVRPRVWQHRPCSDFDLLCSLCDKLCANQGWYSCSCLPRVLRRDSLNSRTASASCFASTKARLLNTRPGLACACFPSRTAGALTAAGRTARADAARRRGTRRRFAGRQRRSTAPRDHHRAGQRGKDMNAPDQVRPNPSIEGTCNIRLRRLSPAPHVKR